MISTVLAWFGLSMEGAKKDFRRLGIWSASGLACIETRGRSRQRESELLSFGSVTVQYRTGRSLRICNVLVWAGSVADLLIWYVCDSGGGAFSLSLQPPLEGIIGSLGAAWMMTDEGLQAKTTKWLVPTYHLSSGFGECPI